MTIMIIGIFGLTPFIIFGLYSQVVYSVHRDMVKERCEMWDYGSMEDLEREFDKYIWEARKHLEEGLFVQGFFDHNAETNTFISADIICFEGKGMVMKNIIEYWRMKLFVKREYNKRVNSNRQVGLWKNKEEKRWIKKN